MRIALLMMSLFFFLRLSKPAVAEESTESNKPFFAQVGFSFQGLIPNRLPQFSNSLPAYGPVIGVPVGEDIIRLQFLYTSQKTFRLYWLDACYRWTLKTPFFTGFFSSGAHYFHYSLLDSFDVFGGNIGTGLLLTFSKSLQVDIGMRAFVQKKMILSFGGGLSFFL